jgi:hypothetical protein
MFPGSPRRAGAEVFSLKNSFLCIDCESISNRRYDECPICHSRSVCSLARMLGGSLVVKTRGPEQENGALYNLEIKIQLQQMSAEEVNATVKDIANVIAPSLGQDRGSFHTDVEPVVAAAPQSQAA